MHNPEEVIYNRVKDLFEAAPQRQPLSALTGESRDEAKFLIFSKAPLKIKL